MCCFVLACEAINDINTTESLVGGKFLLVPLPLCTSLRRIDKVPTVMILSFRTDSSGQTVQT